MAAAAAYKPNPYSGTGPNRRRIPEEGIGDSPMSSTGNGMSHIRIRKGMRVIHIVKGDGDLDEKL